MSKTITFDLESNSLLNEKVINYLSSPYKLKDNFKLHCIVVEEHGSGKIIAFYNGHKFELDGRRYRIEKDGVTYQLSDYTPIDYDHRQMTEFKSYVQENVCKVIGHNIINFDLLVCKLAQDLDYSVEPDRWGDKPVEIEDTLVTSKTLNPDRFGGHSLDSLGKKVGLSKLEFRKHIPEDKRFEFWFADMLYYCIRDVQVNTKVFNWLESEKQGWKWGDALKLEKAVAEIITRQEHRGFAFNRDLAENNVKVLDQFMEERRAKVEPLLPPRKPTKKFLSDNTPPVKQVKVEEIFPPARQYKKDGSLSNTMEKFLEKYNGKMEGDNCIVFGQEFRMPMKVEKPLKVEKSLYPAMQSFISNMKGEVSDDLGTVTIQGKIYKLPMPVEPITKVMEAKISDTTHIKDWLVGLGWNPSEWKDRDITTNSKKEKITDEKYEEAVNKYVEQTLNSNFCAERCEYLKTTPEKLKQTLMSKNRSRSVKVLTNPMFTVGQEKEMCPNLGFLSTTFPFTKDLVEYLTFRHRRNSILGGGLEWEDEDEAEKGYLAYVREDGRIPTPADTCGAATSRMKHRCVANIPRVTSLFGEEMRGMFGVTEGFYQIGYDFDSLEAKQEAHYCWRWEEGKEKEYCNSLTLEKPLDVHTSLAKKISLIIKKEFGRTPAKSTKYAATYGATAPKIAKTIGESLAVGEQVFEAFWKAALPLKKLKEALARYWETTGNKKFILGIDGRQVPTRSPHAILNSLFQSAGVICAKRAMVIHDRMLKKEGLAVDFFKDNWKDKLFAQQLIAYHDEAQLEESKKLVRFKTLRKPPKATEQQIENLKSELKEIKNKYEKEGEVWSDLAETSKAVYIAYSPSGDLAAKAVKLAGEYYNLNVPLTAGYIVGRDWAECH